VKAAAAVETAAAVKAAAAVETAAAVKAAAAATMMKCGPRRRRSADCRSGDGRRDQNSRQSGFD
jgi:uncharacterized membrane protein